MGRLVSTCYLGKAANPTVIWGQQRRDDCTDDREENSMTTLFSVAPKRRGRVGGPPQALRRSQKLAESDSQQPEGVTPRRNKHTCWHELSKPDGNAATLEDNAGAVGSDPIIKDKMGQLFISGATNSDTCYYVPPTPHSPPTDTASAGEQGRVCGCELISLVVTRLIFLHHTKWESGIKIMFCFRKSKVQMYTSETIL